MSESHEVEFTPDRGGTPCERDLLCPLEESSFSLPLPPRFLGLSKREPKLPALRTVETGCCKLLLGTLVERGLTGTELMTGEEEDSTLTASK